MSRFVVLLPAIAGLVCAADAASARSDERAQQPAPLAVRYKPEVRPTAGSGPFALLAAFPEVVRRASRENQRATIRMQSPRASLVQSGGQPLPGNRALSSGFGMRRHPVLGRWRPHHGVDLAAPTGTPVHATADGIVSAAGRRGGYGISVTLGHGQGMETRYAHLSRLNVARGQGVQRGEVIGWVGSTGLSTGPHLHYETRMQGRPVNPLPYLRRKKSR